MALHDLLFHFLGESHVKKVPKMFTWQAAPAVCGKKKKENTCQFGTWIHPAVPGRPNEGCVNQKVWATSLISKSSQNTLQIFGELEVLA